MINTCEKNKHKSSLRKNNVNITSHRDEKNNSINFAKKPLIHYL